MTDLRKKLTAPEDPKGRLIAIFVGAVLVPSLALSYVSWHFVKKVAAHEKISKKARADSVLVHLEKELTRAARWRALEAAQVAGVDRLLDGRNSVVQPALLQYGIGDDVFETLHLEGSSPRVAERRSPRRAAESDEMKELLTALEPMPEGAHEDAVAWIGADGRITGTLRFKFTCEYLHERFIRDYFQREFREAEQALVVRVTKEDGAIVYETAPTTTQRFEVKKALESPSLRGLKLFLRYRDTTIEQDVNRAKMGTFALVGFIDLMLGAGLILVYSNVRREMHLSRLKSDFVANVSHELKTPLALVRLFAETLEMGRVHSAEKKHEYYHVINKESQRLTQLINNILDFSRIEAGRKEYRFAPTHVPRVVENVLETYRFQIEQQGMTLEVDLQEDLPSVMADEEALTQAVLNLVNNAIKYSRDDKYLKVAARRDGDSVRLSVADHGIGVAKSEHKKIFDKFYRAEDSLVHDTKGSGLGLSLVQHIMESHGGRVEVESTPGRGSTFTLVLPLGEDGSTQHPAAGAQGRSLRAEG